MEDDRLDNTARVDRWLLKALAAIAVIVVAGVAWSEARGHTAISGMVFDRWCCSGNAVNGDCQPIPLSSIKEIEGGYQVTLSPGDHPMVTRVHVYQMEESKVRWTTDGEAYACLYPNEDSLRCLYLPPPGS